MEQDKNKTGIIEENMNNYTLTASNITATGVTITLKHTSGNAPVATQIIIVSLNNTEVSRQSIDDESLIDAVGESTSVNFSNLTPSTAYTVSLNSGDGIASNITFTTLATPIKFVQLQNKAGENIYPIVPDGGKAIIEVTDTDPGEGVPLQENHFIAVYGDATRIQTNDIADGAVTAAKIDCTTTQNMELFYSYNQDTSVTSGTVNIDVPVDLVNYHRIRIEAACEPNSGDTSATANALTTSKGTINTFQTGWEVWNGTWAAINRQTTEMIAYGQTGSCSTHIDIEIFRASSINYPTFIANGFGGSDASNRRAQSLQGRIQTGSSSIGYIRVSWKVPQSGGWLRAYRWKET